MHWYLEYFLYSGHPGLHEMFQITQALRCHYYLEENTEYMRQSNLATLNILNIYTDIVYSILLRFIPFPNFLSSRQFQKAAFVAITGLFQGHFAQLGQGRQGLCQGIDPRRVFRSFQDDGSILIFVNFEACNGSPRFHREGGWTGRCVRAPGELAVGIMDESCEHFFLFLL